MNVLSEQGHISPQNLLGIDFSGSLDAGNRIWVTTGRLDANTLSIEDCCPARHLPGSAKDRASSLVALRRFILDQRDCVCGFDFPFGLPFDIVHESDWVGFVTNFGNRHVDPIRFQKACYASANGRELRRLTDEDSRTPFSPYNLRLFRQTYYGIRDVLAPLIRDEQICVLPMQKLELGKPCVIEICPASTLKTLNLYRPYKGRDTKTEQIRVEIIRCIEERERVSIPRSIYSTIMGDWRGDALDSVIASIAVLRSLPSLPSSWPKINPYAIEGFIYV